MEKSKITQKTNNLLILTSILGMLVFLNIIFLFLMKNEVKTIKLIRNELNILEQDKQIINASETIKAQYSHEINAVSSVFPNEVTIPLFIQTMESIIKEYSDEYTFKFNSLTPIAEGDKLYLLITIMMKTDQARLFLLLNKLEILDYMTHITGISAKMPNGFTDKGEFNIGLKVYVQNPFNTN